ncbi:hypothetical protein HY570_01370 [Candidatus Micrarchaeota archaeon]|nr:hypothetical protein [Candidatus Micrarchaeota archaeon]
MVFLFQTAAEAMQVAAYRRDASWNALSTVQQGAIHEAVRLANVPHEKILGFTISRVGLTEFQSLPSKYIDQIINGVNNAKLTQPQKDLMIDALKKYEKEYRQNKVG